MPFKHKDLHIKNEEGSGLILALMTLMVLSVLGASLGAITIGSYKLGDVNRDDTSAYYIAEAGANMAYEEIKTGVLAAYSKYPDSEVLFYNEIDDRINNNRIINLVNGKTYENFDNQFGDSPTASIRIPEPEGSNPKNYTIVSTGEVAGKKRTVEKPVDISWIEKNPEQKIYLPEYASILSKSGTEIKNNGVTIIGDIHIDALGPPGFKSTNEFEFNDNVFFHPDLKGNFNKVTQGGIAKKTENLKTRDKALPWAEYISIVEGIKFPDYSSYPYLADTIIKKDSNQHAVISDGSILITDYKANNYILDLEGNYRVNSLSINANRTLNIKTNNNTVNLVVDEINISQGNINITDNGILNIFVLNKFSFGGDSAINKNNSKEQFNLYYAGENKITFSGNQFINGGVYIRQSDLLLTGSGNIGGTIVSNGDFIEIKGGSVNNAFFLAPKARISIKEGGNIKGVVIADQIDLDGGTKIEFSEINTEDFPFKTSSPSGGGNTFEESDLIKAIPAIESK